MTPFQQFQLHRYGNIILQGKKAVPAINFNQIVGNCIYQRNGITIHQHADGFTVCDGTDAITVPNAGMINIGRLKAMLAEYKSGGDEHIELENGADISSMLIQEQIEAACNDAYGY